MLGDKYLNFIGFADLCEAPSLLRQSLEKRRWGAVVANCSLAVLLSACSGALGGGPATTLIVTEPAKANCILSGKGYSARVTTPIKTKLPKSAAPIKLSCSASGHRTFVTILKPTFNDKVLHNFLLGSSVGIAVDLMNGNHEKFPKRVVLHLEPSSFANVAARDFWFARYRQFIEFKWRRILDDIQFECSESSGENGNCQDAVGKARSEREYELQKLEQRRKRAALNPNFFGQTSNLPAIR